MHRAIWIICVIMLLVALAPLPYGYYTLLRIVVCAATGYLAWSHASKLGLDAWVFTLGGIAVLFNPIIPVHLEREVWAFIDVAAAVVIGAHYFSAGQRLFPAGEREIGGSQGKR